MYFKAAIWRASHVDALRRRIVPRRSSTPRVPSSIEPAGRSSRPRRFFRAAHARAPKLRASHPFGAVQDVLRDFGHHPGGARDLLANGPPLREVSHHQGASGASVRRSIDSRSPRARARAPRARRLDPPFRSLPRRFPARPPRPPPDPTAPRPSSRRRPANARDQDPAHPRRPPPDQGEHDGEAQACGATSIPGMLAVFHNEWDALISDPGSKSHATRQELSHALYQHDAARRVIARLVKERDEARAALADAQGAPGQSRASAPGPAASAPCSRPRRRPRPRRRRQTRQGRRPLRRDRRHGRQGEELLRRVRSAVLAHPRTASPRSLRDHVRVIPPSAGPPRPR